MNIHLPSIVSNHSQEIRRGQPNQFCLSLFQKNSSDAFNNHSLFIPKSIEFFNDSKVPSTNPSNFFQFTQNQNHLPSPKYDFSGEGRLPSLDYFIRQKSDTLVKVENIQIEANNCLKDQQTKIDRSNKINCNLKSTLFPARSNPAIRDYKKNICRNILRHAIKAMSSAESYEFFLRYFTEPLLQEFIQFYSQKLEYISGFRLLKCELIVKSDDTIKEKSNKDLFRRYLEWFINERATVYIMKGEADNIKEYLTYKNEVLMYYIKNPQQWYSNKPLWKETPKIGIVKKIAKKQKLVIGQF